MFKLSSWFGKGGEPRTLCATLVLLFTFLSITLILVISVAKVYLLEGVKSKENEAFYSIGYNITETKTKPTFIAYIQVLAVDPLLFTSKLGVKLKRTNLGSTIPNNTQIVLGGSLTPINNETMEVDKELSSLTLNEGNVNHYPYDHYSISLPFGQRKRQRKNSPDISFLFAATGALQNWRIKLAFVPEKSPSLVNLEIVIFRPWSTRVFSMFIVGSMWLVTIAVVCITFQMVVGDREIVRLTYLLNSGCL